jgi:membrane peptidoglycan carboxypeptidase
VQKYLKKWGIMNKKLLAVITSTAIVLSVSTTSTAFADNNRGEKRMSSILSGLVSNGTITQSQADAIVKASEGVKAASKAVRDANRTALDSVITSTLGISLDTVVSRLKAGETLSTIAGDKKSALITALVAEINKQIDTALAAGKITANQATAQKGKSVQRVTNMVDNVKGFGKKANRPGVLPKRTSASSTSFKTA